MGDAIQFWRAMSTTVDDWPKQLSDVFYIWLVFIFPHTCICTAFTYAATIRMYIFWCWRWQNVHNVIWHLCGASRGAHYERRLTQPHTRARTHTNTSMCIRIEWKKKNHTVGRDWVSAFNVVRAAYGMHDVTCDNDTNRQRAWLEASGGLFLSPFESSKVLRWVFFLSSSSNYFVAVLVVKLATAAEADDWIRQIEWHLRDFNSRSRVCHFNRLMASFVHRIIKYWNNKLFPFDVDNAEHLTYSVLWRKLTLQAISSTVILEWNKRTTRSDSKLLKIDVCLPSKRSLYRKTNLFCRFNPDFPGQECFLFRKLSVSRWSDTSIWRRCFCDVLKLIGFMALLYVWMITYFDSFLGVNLSKFWQLKYIYLH